MNDDAHGRIVQYPVNAGKKLGPGKLKSYIEKRKLEEKLKDKTDVPSEVNHVLS